MPRALTYEEAASPPSSQLFVLVGFAVVMPVILGYTAIGYRVFSGKVKPGEHYH